jgi:hypothetical protein
LAGRPLGKRTVEIPKKRLEANISADIRNIDEPGSSVSIVSGYKLNDRVNEVRSPAEVEDFSSYLCVHTGSGAHPACYPMGTEGPSPGGKARPRRDADNSTPSSAEVVNEQKLYLLSPCASTGVL